MSNVPDSLIWQGQKVFFMGTKSFPDMGCVRYDFGVNDKVVMMQWDFGQCIDWQALEEANKAAPVYEIKPKVRKDYSVKKKRILENRYAEFVAWLEAQEK